jgi:parvulin-like peptidyl-prolyl isomerase
VVGADFSQGRLTMRPYFQLIAVGLLCCGCQGTGPAKYDNPVVGPPPPRLPAEQIQRKKLAAAEMRDRNERDTKLASNKPAEGEDDALLETDRPIQQASAKRSVAQVGQNPDEEAPVHASGLLQVKLDYGPKEAIPRLDDGVIVATVNSQPIFAGEILAPAVNALANKELEMRKALGTEFRPEMLDRVRIVLIYQSLPRAIERKMLMVAAKNGLKKQQLEGMQKAVAVEWQEHLEEMMTQNHVASLPELEALFKKSNFNLEEHKQSFDDQRGAHMYVMSKAHTKYQPSRIEMINFYNEHKDEFKTVGKVRWQHLVVSFEAHKGPEFAKAHLDKVVKELLAGADFTATVKKYGDGPKAAKGGVWEWTERGSLKNKDVENEIFTLPIGDMSGVIESKSDYQIVQVLERTEDTYIPYEQLQEKIKSQMMQEVYTKKADAVLKAVREASIVETCFDDWDRRKAVPKEE